MAGGTQDVDRGIRCVWGMLLVALCLFGALSLFSYDWHDIGWLVDPPNRPTTNLIGPVGAWLSFLLFNLFGVGAYLLPCWCLSFGLFLMFSRCERVWPKGVWSLVLVTAFIAMFELNPDRWVLACHRLNILPHTSGLVGRLLMQAVLIRWFSPVGAGIVMWAVLLTAVVLTLGSRTTEQVLLFAGECLVKGWGKTREFFSEQADRRKALEREQRQLEKERRRLERRLQKEAAAAEKEERARIRLERVVPGKKQQEARQPQSQPEPEPEPAPVPAVPVPTGDYKLPPLSLLEKRTAPRAIKADEATTSRILIDTLNDFGIEVEITNIEKGPVVTRYELLPAPGVRVERIAGLANNLALSLKAHNVRVQAPIPGKGVVGVEVPNTTANAVYLREILESDVWQSGNIKVPLVLGKDVGGNDLAADLASMPHLLVAGATGAGKTVCMNSILAGLLMSRTPDQLKLMLVDPKIVEFSVYNHLPHLVVPVITDPKKVALGLRWAIKEMERRYKVFAKAGVRNIESFNNREVARQVDLFGENEAGEQDAIPQTLPYIVIIIDELADLMLADQANIENCVARLAQLSRAVGIHMILSTQRPSVNVITGTIKANFPARIAFQVAQKVDSRTILDTVGAEKLLGRGDMLFLPPGSSKLVRVQGALTTDDEIRDIVKFIKDQSGPSYEVEIKEKLETSTPASLDDGEDDELLGQAVEIIRETKRASTSSLQRRLRIGYTRAARMMDILEERGIIGPPRGSDPREILIDLDGEIPNNDATQPSA